LVFDDLRTGSKPKFGHGISVALPSGLTLIGRYHPSQQNMFTGRQTPEMLDTVFGRAGEIAGIKPD
jgi:uracil-DNA glycosylase